MFTKVNKYKVLITGSLGFISSNFLRRAVASKTPYTMVSIDKVVDSHLFNNFYLNKSLTNSYIADIKDSHIIDKIFEFERPEIVIHAAGVNNDDFNESVNSNIIGTNVVLNASKKFGVKKILYLSTDQVYGPSGNEEHKFTEDARMTPAGVFAISKASAEMFLLDYCKKNNLEYMIARISNVYGPRQSVNGFIPNIIKKIANNQDLSLDDSALRNRDWMHVFDLCSGLVKLLENDVNNEIYNVSSGQYFSNLEIAYEICKFFGKDPSTVKFNNSDLDNTWLNTDNSKIKKLDWQVEYKFKQNISAVCEWYQNNKWFLK